MCVKTKWTLSEFSWTLDSKFRGYSMAEEFFIAHLPEVQKNDEKWLRMAHRCRVVVEVSGYCSCRSTEKITARQNQHHPRSLYKNNNFENQLLVCNRYFPYDISVYIFLYITQSFQCIN